MFSRPLQRYITSPKISKISVGKTKKNCSRLTTAEQTGQKKRNGKSTIVLFAFLSTSALKKSQASACYW